MVRSGLKLARQCSHVRFIMAELSQLLNLPPIRNVLNGSPKASRSTLSKSYFSFAMNEANCTIWPDNAMTNIIWLLTYQSFTKSFYYFVSICWMHTIEKSAGSK